MRRWAFCAAFMTLAMPAFGQSMDFQQLISGKEVPLHLKLKDLNGDWRRMGIGGLDRQKGGMGDLMSQIMPMAMMGEMSGKGKGKGNNADAAGAAFGMALMSSLFGGGGGDGEPVYYTKGQTVTVGSVSFLVAYRWKKREANWMQMAMEAGKNGGKEPDMSQLAGDKLSGESDLSLTLVNLKKIGDLSDIRPFDLDKEIEESGKGGGLMDLIAADPVQKVKAAEVAPLANADTEALTKEFKLESQVNDAIKADTRLGSARNQIAVEMGEKMVTLRGQVATAALKQRAEATARKALKEAGSDYKLRNSLTVRAKKRQARPSRAR